MKRRHADPAELVHSSKLVAAWNRRLAELADGNDLANEHWYAFLRTMARPVPRPNCEYCDDVGIAVFDCTLAHRCQSRQCEPRDRRGDPDWTHTYARACSCAAGQPYTASFAAAQTPVHPQPSAPARKTSYGFGRPTEVRR